MTTRDAEAIFLDTNVLVYAQVRRAPFHQEALQAIEQHYAAGVPLWISRQVLREYLAVLSRPQRWSAPQPLALLAEDVRYFQQRFQVADEGPQVTAHLLALLEQVPVGGRQVHDANIVATMLVYSVPRLLTHNTDDFLRFVPRITVLPLV